MAGRSTAWLDVTIVTVDIPPLFYIMTLMKIRIQNQQYVTASEIAADRKISLKSALAQVKAHPLKVEFVNPHNPSGPPINMVPAVAFGLK